MVGTLRPDEEDKGHSDNRVCTEYLHTSQVRAQHLSGCVNTAIPNILSDMTRMTSVCVCARMPTATDDGPRSVCFSSTT